MALDRSFTKWSIAYKGAQEPYYSYCKTHHIHNFGKQRLVINHRKADLSDSAAYFICNKWQWQAGGITPASDAIAGPLKSITKRGKADGLDQYQVRTEAISWHIALVAVTYSLLRAAQHDEAPAHKLQRHVQTTLDGSAGIGVAIPRHALWTLATFIAAGLSQGQTLQDVMEPLVAMFVSLKTSRSVFQVVDAFPGLGASKLREGGRMASP